MRPDIISTGSAGGNDRDLMPMPAENMTTEQKQAMAETSESERIIIYCFVNELEALRRIRGSLPAPVRPDANPDSCAANGSKNN